MKKVEKIGMIEYIFKNCGDFSCHYFKLIISKLNRILMFAYKINKKKIKIKFLKI